MPRFPEGVSNLSPSLLLEAANPILQKAIWQGAQVSGCFRGCRERLTAAEQRSNESIVQLATVGSLGHQALPHRAPRIQRVIL
jgi:hypothetical protein